MKFFHRTDAAEAILREGFREASGSYGLANTALTGVFISDMILDISDGARGEDVIEIVLPGHFDLAPYALIEEMTTHLEWCVPAAILNDPATELRVLSQDEIDEIELSQIRRFM